MTVRIVIWLRGRSAVDFVQSYTGYFVLSCGIQLQAAVVHSNDLVDERYNNIELDVSLYRLTAEDQKQVLNFLVTNLDSHFAAPSSQYKQCITKSRSYRSHLLAFCYCCALFQKGQPKASYILHCCWEVLELQMRVTPVVCILTTIRTVCVNSLKSSPNNSSTPKTCPQKTEICILIAVRNSDIQGT